MSQLLEAELIFNHFTYGDMVSKRRQMAGGTDRMFAVLFYRFHPKIKGHKNQAVVKIYHCTYRVHIGLRAPTRQELWLPSG